MTAEEEGEKGKGHKKSDTNQLFPNFNLVTALVFNDDVWIQLSAIEVSRIMFAK